MKKLIGFLMIIGLLLVSACSVEVVQTEATESDAQTFVAEESEAASTYKFFELRITENDLDPDEIRVNQGDNVKLSVSNLVELDDKDVIRFEINRYPVDEAVYEGTPTIIEFTADKKGLFIMGDMNHLTRKGMLIVE